MIGIALILFAGAKDTIPLADMQRAAGALAGANKACLGLGDPYAKLAEKYLDRHTVVLANWGEYLPASGLYSFKTTGTAKAAKEYMEKAVVKTDVYNFFNDLSLAQRVIGEIPLVSGGAIKVKIGTHWHLAKDNPQAYALIKTLADVYGVTWPPAPGPATVMPGDYITRVITVKDWVRAVDAIPFDRMDTVYVNVLTGDFKARVTTGFSVGCDLLFSYFSADSLYRTYANDSPYPIMAGAMMDSLASEALKFKEYLTVAKYVFEPVVDTMITNQDGTQTWIRRPEKKGTMWEFISTYHPDIAPRTSAAMKALGVTVP